MQYSQNVFFRFFARTLGFVVYIVFLDVIYTDQNSFAGWSKIDMLLMLGVYRTYFALAESTIFANIRNLGEVIYLATLDKYLLKPVSTLFLSVFEKFHIFDIFDGLLGIIFIGYALTHQHYDISLATLLGLAVLFTMTTILFASLLIAVMSLAFRGSRVDNAYWILDDLLKLSAMPSQLHAAGWGAIFKFVIPITLIASVPVEFIKGILSPNTALIYVCLTIIWVIIARGMWKDGLKRYTGAG